MTQPINSSQNYINNPYNINPIKEDLAYCSKRISEIALLDSNNFFIQSNDTFKIYEDTLCNRIITYFSSRTESLEALDDVITKCSKVMESFRLGFQTDEELKSIHSDKKLLQTLDNHLDDLYTVGLGHLEKTWDDPESLDQINALKSKISLLKDSVASFSNFVTIINRNKNKSKEDLLKQSTNDKHLNEYIVNIFNNENANNEEISYFSKSSIRLDFTKRFGPAITNDLLKMYALDTAEFISSNDLKGLLIGLAANITEVDLLHIQANNQDIFNFDPSATSLDILNQIRSLSLISNKQLDSFKNAPYYYQLKKDLTFVKKLSSVENFNLASSRVKTAELDHFGATEYLSRRIAYSIFDSDEYASFREGTLIPVPDYSTGSREIILMRAHELVSHKGLHGLVLIPCDVDNPRYALGMPLHVVFRGSHNLAAWNRNLNPMHKDRFFSFEGPGNNSFKKKKQPMLEKLDQVLKQLPKDASIKFGVMGHSLGSSDSQRMCEAIAEHIYQAKDENSEISHKSPLNSLNVKEVNYFGYNSPGVEDSLNNSFLEYAKKIPNTVFQLRYFKAHRDLIQKIGGCFLGAHSKESPLPNNVKATVIKFRKPEDAYTRNPILRFGLVPHLQYNLTQNCNKNKNLLNDVWVEKIRTNNPQDEGLHYQGIDPNAIPKTAQVNPEKLLKSLKLKSLISKLYQKCILILRFIGMLIMEYVIQPVINLFQSIIRKARQLNVCPC